MVEKRPAWLKKQVPTGRGFERTHDLLTGLSLHTVCQEALCPNLFECYQRDTATFLIMGDRCTRNCSFCAISNETPGPLDPAEPSNVALAVKELNLDYAVITSVTRDDLTDGGAGHYVRTVHEIKHLNPGTTIELLVPDFKGSGSAPAKVIESCPDVLNHNLETVPRLYPGVRPLADYKRSLKLLKDIKSINPDIVTKSGIMLGLGEERGEVLTLFDDLRGVDCEILTIGQYLRPGPENIPVADYIHPDLFRMYEEEARKRGFRAVASAPFVRSSYKARDLLEEVEVSAIQK